MYNLRLVLTLAAALASQVNALPEQQQRGEHRIKLHVHNKCNFVKEFGLYKITPDFQMEQHGESVNIQPHQSHTFHPKFHATGMRLSGHAEWGVAGQWNPQALFEFGYSEYAGTTGTAYDLSVMSGSDGNIGIGVYPKNGACESKTCFPWDCPADQGWTNPDQTDIGSPADTVCYQGKTDFKVVFCP